MFKKIDYQSGIPVYEQIEFQVVAAISSGMISAGEQLPSIREVADLMGINPNTVAKSFKTLESKGFTYSRRGMGIFISDDAQSKARADCQIRLRRALQSVRDDAARCGLDWKAYLD